MRKIILFIHSTFNGVVTGDPKEDKNNFNVWTTDASNESGSAYLLEAMQSVDTVLLGRSTYESLNRAWPFIADWGPVSDPVSQLGVKMNSVPKLIVTGDRPLINYGEQLFDGLKKRKDFNLVSVKPLEDGDTMVVIYKPTETRDAAMHHEL